MIKCRAPGKRGCIAYYSTAETSNPPNYGPKISLLTVRQKYIRLNSRSITKYTTIGDTDGRRGSSVEGLDTQKT